MSHEIFYPPLQIGAVRALLTIRQELALNPDYLVRSPYDFALESALSDLFGLKKGKKQNSATPLNEDKGMLAITEEDVKNLDVSDEVSRLYIKLKNYETTAENLEPNQRVQIFRVSTALLEKLLGYGERAADLKNFVKFKETVISTMAKFLTPEQHGEFQDLINQK